MRPLTSTNSSRTFLLSAESSSAACREGELIATEENARTKKRKGKIVATRGKRSARANITEEVIDQALVARKEVSKLIYSYGHRHNDKHVLWPLHFEKKLKKISGLIHTRSHVMTSSLTIAKLMSGSLSGYMRRKNSFTDGSVHAVSIGSGIRTLFT
ncbi:hypothetical protein G9A89_014959 [Geosiphon pyriformis]|nr:hypothetical protein G9A89_014959 [Geosiphon pyriformis]